MSEERDPRVVKIAEKLAETQPYGFDFRKKLPSAADYHAALIAVKALDEDVEYEYAVQGENLYRGGTYCSPWFRIREWADGYLEEAKELPKYFGPVKEEYGNFKIVKRRKAGEVEDA